MIVVKILLPNRFGDTRELIPKTRFNHLIQQLWLPFSGCTMEGWVSGHWINPQTGKDEPDRSLKISIAIDPEHLPQLRELIKKAGLELRQKAMYYEISGTAEILQITE